MGAKVVPSRAPLLSAPVVQAMNEPNVWDQVLSRVERKVNRHVFYTWFKHSSLVRELADTLLVRVPNPFVRDWLTKHYAGILAESLAEAGRPGTTLKFATDEELDRDHAMPAEAHPEGADTAEVYGGPNAQDAPPPVITASGLNPRYTFDSFVVGSSNQFAHAACRAVAEAPSRSYNPLFLYGGVGLGKTHMMHAIGHYVLTQAPLTRLTYISAERFMNEMINALRYERILDFRDRYRSVDLLLVDDIQFIAGKEGTQTEFFHTFNALYDSAKQIVITSDCPPHEIPQLEERLRSRFEWGLIADIQPPDIETKVAILKKKADAEGVPLPDNVALYIAGKIKSNIRELEGSLIRLIAYASLHGLDITLPLTQDVLKDLLNTEERAVTVEVIQKFVADYYQLKVSELKSRNNAKSVAMPRQVAMYLCKTLTRASLPEIGRAFGGKHHSTVIHSIRKVEDLRRKDADFNSQMSGLLDNFR